MDEGPAPAQEDFSTLPIADRLTHKNWKARVSGYETLVQTFGKTASETDPAFKPYINNPDLLKKIVTDSNAVAQEKGVESIVALVKFAGESAARTREAVVPALVDKCFGSARAGTKANALELVLQYVEMENSGAGVVGDILPGLAAKQPKAVAGCVLALKEIIRVYGTQTTPPPPILKAIPKIFAHSDKTVRAEGTLLVQTIYQYIGPGIEPWLADLKPVQIKELKESFDSMESDGKGKGTLKPERLTRTQAREAEANAGQGDGGQDDAAEDAEPEVLDPSDFAEPVDVTSKLPANLHTNLTSSKWKERKEALDDLLTLLAATPRLKEASELGDIAKALAIRIQSDANVNCVMTAAACQEALAKGLKGAFGKYREMVVAPMLERLKERKANVTDAIGAALDAVFATTTLSEIIPDLGPALASKNPQVKEGTLKFLSRCLAKATSPIQGPQIKPLSETLATLLEDGHEGARNETAVCLGTLMKMVGERPLNPIMDGLADVRKAKITEAFEKATVKCKAGGAPPPRSAPPTTAPVKKAAPKAAPAKGAAPKAAVTPKINTPATDDSPPPAPKAAAQPPARLTQTKTPAAAVVKKPAASSSKPAKPPAPAAAGSLDTFKYKHTAEDSEALAADLIPASITAGFADANWKTRLAALDEATEWLEGVSYDVDAEVVVRTFAKKGWSDKNFQVSAKLYGILVQLAQRSPSFGRSCVALCVGHLTEKLGDMKLKKPAGDTLTTFAEKTSLQFVLNQAYDPLSKQKAPKVLADATTWVSTAMTEFGIAGISLRALIEFLKVGLANSNSAVRTSATKTLVTLKLFAGSGIKDLLEDVNPQLLNTITAEFDKAEGQAPPEPSRISQDVAVTATTSGGDAPGGNEDALDDLFPRVELDGLFKGTTILADAKSDAWKTKKEALEQLQSILDQGSNKRLKPNMGDIAQILKARITDTNKAVQSLALDIVCRIAVGMGRPFEKHARHFVQPVATVLSDQKAPIRASALTALTAMADACQSLEPMVAGITSGLDTANPLQKGQLLHWISEWTTSNQVSPSLDTSTWVASVVASLDDRNGDVRKGAQGILPLLITTAGYDYVMQQTSSLKPASRSSAVPLIQAARANATGPPSIEAPPAKPAPTKAAVNKAPPPPPESPVPSSPVIPSSVPAAPGSKLSGVRRKLPQGTSRPETPVEDAQPSRLLKGPVRKAGPVIPPAKPVTPPQTALILTGTNGDLRRTRIGKDATKWINEGGAARKDLVELLHSQMETSASKDLLSRLFSHDHNAVNDHISGLNMLLDLYTSATSATSDADENVVAVSLANFDYPLRYTSLKLHESQPNLVSKCLDVIESVLSFLRSVNCQLTDNEALCFIPTVVYKLGDAREQVRSRVQSIIQTLPLVYAYSRVFTLLLDHGLKSRVAKTRQGALDELASILKRSGLGACEPTKSFPIIASMLSDKDTAVRKSTLAVLSEGYALVGEKIWTLVGRLSPKDKTQLEERLRRVAGPPEPAEAKPVPQVSRLVAGLPRPASPAGVSRIGGLPRPASPSVTGNSRFNRPASPSQAPPRATSPGLTAPGNVNRPGSPSQLPSATSYSGIGRPKSMLPSRLGRPRSNFGAPPSAPPPPAPESHEPPKAHNEHTAVQSIQALDGPLESPVDPSAPEDITVTISTILSSDAGRSVDALKKVQKILTVGQANGPSSPQYRELAEHTEGLIETITLQVAHIFERPEDLLPDDNFRLAKHLIQTLNTFCDHAFLAESLTVDILTSLLEELTLRLLETDDSPIKKVKDLSRFINMILLRLFSTARRMSIFRALFNLLLQIVKPFPANGTMPDSKESKVAELVLKCVWKLVRNIPQDLEDQKLDPVELFPALEYFLQSVPPNEWRARATNKVPCGDMPLRTVKVIIQHVVAHYADDVYDLLSASFDDPSATIVYPYVYRILNSTSRIAQDIPPTGSSVDAHHSPTSSSRPISPQLPPSVPTQRLPPPATASSSSHRSSPSSSSFNGNGRAEHTSEPDPDAQLLVIISHISSETTGALHKEGITELHHFLKAYPHKRPRVDKMLEATGAAFRKYITRTLANRALEDQERDVAVADTLSKLESNQRDTAGSTHQVETGTPPHSPRSLRKETPEETDTQNKLSRLHNLFQYRSSTLSTDSSHGRATPRTSLS